MPALISIDELVRLRRKSVILFAYRGDRPRYGIPGSIAANIDVDFSDAHHPLPATVTDNPRRDFAAFGITTKTPVVVYDDSGGLLAPRLWWLARVAGLDHVAVLDGGLSAWKETVGEAEALAEPPQAGAVQPTGALEWERLADAADVRQALDDPYYHIVDVRNEALFTGAATMGPQYRPGHIPGSVNIPAQTLLGEDNRMRPTDRIRDILESAVGPTSALIFTCHTGVTACVGALAANLAGYGDVRVYEGSWAEWGLRANDPQEFPVAEGL